MQGVGAQASSVLASALKKANNDPATARNSISIGWRPSAGRTKVDPIERELMKVPLGERSMHLQALTEKHLADLKAVEGNGTEQ